MTEITAAVVKDLRERTGAGMMDCKKALAETKGDMEAAVDWLRTKGLAVASKKAGRTAAEGLVGVVASGNKGAMVEVNAETDFVARNDKFQSFVKELTQIALQNGEEMSALTAASYPEEERSVSEQLTHLVSVIGENMNFRRAKVLEVTQGAVAGYTHNAVQPGLGKIGVLVALESTGDSTKLAQLAKHLAMHIAAAAPQACRMEDLDPQIIERERKIFFEKDRSTVHKNWDATELNMHLKSENKSLEEKVEEDMKKFFKEAVLFEQVFLMDEQDSKRRVAQVIKDATQDIGAEITSVQFAMFRLGEGIEKEVKDFAAEVAEQLAR